MALSTYSELQATALDVIGRTGDAALTAYAPVAVLLAEAKINRKLRVMEMEANATGSSTNGVIALPTDFAGWRRVEASPYGPLQFQEPDYLAARYPAGEGGIPTFFTIQGTNLITYPAYTGDVSLDYYQRIPALSDTAPTNWVLTNHPDIYLFLTLSELNAYAKDAEAALMWNQRGITAVEEVNTDDKTKRYSRVAARVKGPTP